MVDHIFLHCQLSMGLWHILFSLVHLDWASSRNICNMMFILYRGLRNTSRGKELWHLTRVALMWLLL